MMERFLEDVDVGELLKIAVNQEFFVPQDEYPLQSVGQEMV